MWWSIFIILSMLGTDGPIPYLKNPKKVIFFHSQFRSSYIIKTQKLCGIGPSLNDVWAEKSWKQNFTLLGFFWPTIYFNCWHYWGVMVHFDSIVNSRNWWSFFLFISVFDIIKVWLSIFIVLWSLETDVHIPYFHQLLTLLWSDGPFS